MALQVAAFTHACTRSPPSSPFTRTHSTHPHAQIEDPNSAHSTPTHPHAQIEDPNSHVVFDQHNAPTGEFSFTSGPEGEYKLCFTARGGWEAGMGWGARAVAAGSVGQTAWQAGRANEHS